VACGPGDEEAGDIVRADVVQIAGDAERFGGLLPAALCRVQPPADEYQRKNTRQPQQDYQPVSLRKNSATVALPRASSLNRTAPRNQTDLRFSDMARTE